MKPTGKSSLAGQTPPPLPEGGFVTNLEAIEWRVTLPDGQQFGPTVPMIFAQWIVAGRVTPDSLVWRTGWEEWRRAEDAAADLPAPLLHMAESPAAPPLPETPPGATLPPQVEAPTRVEPTPTAPPATGGDSYQLRKKRQAQRRRNFTIGLAVVCLALAAMLVVLMMSGPPEGAPVIPQ